MTGIPRAMLDEAGLAAAGWEIPHSRVEVLALRNTLGTRIVFAAHPDFAALVAAHPARPAQQEEPEDDRP